MVYCYCVLVLLLLKSFCNGLASELLWSGMCKHNIHMKASNNLIVYIHPQRRGKQFTIQDGRYSFWYVPMTLVYSKAFVVC